MSSRKLIHHALPFDVLDTLCRMLNADELWNELARRMPDITADDVAACRRAEDPAWWILRIWSSRGYTVSNLYRLLIRERLIRCAQLVEPHVEDAERQRGAQIVSLSTSGATAASSSSSSPLLPSSTSSSLSAASSSPSTRPASSVNLQQQAPVHSASLTTTTTASIDTNATTSTSTAASLVASLQNTAEVKFEDLEAATDSFSPQRAVGRGGYGTVYRGDWKHLSVAIKRFHPAAEKDAKARRERLRQSLQELKTLARWRHDHILPLYAYSLDGPQPCLVYQFMAGGSLDDRIQCRRGRPPLDWKRRQNIAEGTARALHFLHTVGAQPLIHADVKTANILLDKHDEPKLGDFGLSREGQGGGWDVEEKKPLLASHVKGTLAYLPPEFVRSRIFSTRLDVYAFGVVLLELASGQRAYTEHRQPPGLVDWANTLNVTTASHPQELVAKAADARLPVENSVFQTLFSLGLRCVTAERSARPDFGDVVAMLVEESAVEHNFESS